jgi:hypothetical protein
MGKTKECARRVIVTPKNWNGKRTRTPRENPKRKTFRTGIREPDLDWVGISLEFSRVWDGYGIEARARLVRMF